MPMGSPSGGRGAGRARRGQGRRDGQSLLQRQYPDRMLLGQVEAFLEVARLGNVSRAAEALYVTQPTLTARIQALEKELGEALFVRTGRGVRLTDAGRVFLPNAERAVQAVDDGRQALADLRSASAGRLALGAAPAVSTYVLPPVLKRFAALHPR